MFPRRQELDSDDKPTSFRQIGRELDRPESTVRKFIHRFTEIDSFECKKGSGGKRKTAARDDRQMKRMA